MKPLKQKISITLDEDIIKRVRVLAEDCDRSLSQYISVHMGMAACWRQEVSVPECPKKEWRSQGFGRIYQE